MVKVCYRAESLVDLPRPCRSGSRKVDKGTDCLGEIATHAWRTPVNRSTTTLLFALVITPALVTQGEGAKGMPCGC